MTDLMTARDVDPLVQALARAHAATGQRLRDLGDKAGLTRQQVGKCLDGTLQPTLKLVRQIADALELPLHAGDLPDAARSAMGVHIERLEKELAALRNNADDVRIDALARAREAEQALAAKQREVDALEVELERLAARVDAADRRVKEAEKRTAALRSAAPDPRFLHRLADGLDALTRMPADKRTDAVVHQFRDAVDGVGSPPAVAHWATQP